MIVNCDKLVDIIDEVGAVCVKVRFGIAICNILYTINNISVYFSIC
jgi:hypothetical protein